MQSSLEDSFMASFFMVNFTMNLQSEDRERGAE